MSLENKFLHIADKFLESDASIVQLSTTFNEYVDETKLRRGLLTNKEKAIETEALLNCILQYLHCVIEYAGGGSAQARSANVRQLCHKIFTTVEELKVKNEFIKNLSLPTFEFLFGQPSWIAKEVLRMYGDTINSSERAVRFEALQEKGPYYLGRLMDAIPFGDFEFQVMIVETLYRICTKEILNDMPKVYFLTEELSEAFYNIVTDEFDLTVRYFLNLLNEKEKHVVSLLCNKVTFDDIQLQEPAELNSFKGMWVDFNVTAGTVTLFINNEPFNTLYNRWEMITLFPDNISTKTETSFVFNEEKGRKEGIAKFVLKGPCMLCYTSSQHKLLNCRLLTLHSLDTERFREIFYQVFPKIHRKSKPLQANTVPYKRAYKPLDIISLKSIGTNPSTTFNMAIDAIIAGKKHKSRSGGTKSVTFADSTIHTNSSKSKSISSRKSLNISLNQSIQEDLDSLSSLNHKIKNLRESGGRKLKRNAEFDEISAVSYLSADNLIENTRKSDKRFNFKKIKLSGEEKSDHGHGRSKIVQNCRYNDEFLSSLIELGESVDVLCTSYDREKKSKYTKKEADSTTLVGGLYNTEVLLGDESITSDVFHSIEDIGSSNTKKNFEFKNTQSKKDRIPKTLKKKKDNTINHIIKSSLEEHSSGLSADELLDPKKNVSKEKISNTKRKVDGKNIIKDNATVCENTEIISYLGSELSPDLFIIESQELANNEHKHSIDEPKEILKHNRSKNKKIFQQKSCTLLEMQDSLWIEPVRDCQFDDFDKLKLERPKEVSFENPKFENLPEPDLIQISQPNFQLPFSTTTETFETAKTNLDDEGEPEVQWSGNNLELFQDISQENDNLQSLPQDESPEIDLKSNEEYKSRIKVLSNIQIQPSISRSQMSGGASQTKNSISKQKENIRPVEEIETSVGVSQSTDAKLELGSPKIKQSATIYSNKNFLDADISGAQQKSGGIVETNKKIKNEKHKVEALKKNKSETLITFLTEKEVQIEQKIDCNATSQEIEYSETPKTDSPTNAISQEMEYSETQKTDSPTNAISQEMEYSETQKTDSPTNAISQVMKYSETQKTDSPTNAISQEMEYSETPKTDSPPNAISQEMEYSETQKTDSPTNVRSQEMEYTETQKTDSLTIPPKYEVVTSQPSHEEDPKNCEESSPNELVIHEDISQSSLHPKNTEDIISHINDCSESAMYGEVQSSTFKNGHSESIPSFEGKKLHLKKEEANEKVQIINDSDIKKRIQNDSYAKSKENKIGKTPLRKYKADQIYELSDNNIVEKLEFPKRVIKTKQKRCQIPQKPSKDKTNYNIYTEEKHKGKVANMTDFETQINVLPEKIVPMKQPIDGKVKSQELEYSETQIGDSQSMSPKYEVTTSQPSLEEDAKKSEELFPTEQLLDHKAESQSTSLPKKTEVISQINVEGTMNCEVRSPKIRMPSFQEKKLDQKIEEMACNTGKKDKNRVLIINDIIIGKCTQSESFCEKPIEKKIQNTPARKGRVNQNIKLSDDIIERLMAIEEIPETKTKQKKNKIPKKPSKAKTIKTQNKNLIPFVKLTTMAPTAGKKNLSNIIEVDEDDIPLSKLKKLWRSKLAIENITSQVDVDVQQITEQIDFNKNSKQFSQLHKSSRPQYESDADQRSQMNKEGNYGEETRLNSQTQIKRKKTEIIHEKITINEEESCDKFVKRKGLDDLDSEEANPLVVTKEKKDICANVTLKKTVVDNEPKVIGNRSPKNRKVNNQNQRNDGIPQQPDQKIQNFNGTIEDRLCPPNKGNQLFQKYSEYPPEKEVNLPKQTSVADLDDKLENPEDLVYDEIHKSMQLLFGDDANEPIVKNTNPAPPETSAKVDKNTNITVDTTNSIIAGSLGLLKRGRRLFNPENHEENFLNFTLVEEAMEKDIDTKKPNELQSVSEYKKKKQPKKLSKFEFDKEAPIESTKINESEAEPQRKKQVKHKYKRYSDMHQKESLSKFDFVTNSRKRRLDAIYDKVVERLKSQNGSSRKSYSVTPKPKKSKHDSTGRYDLDFSVMREKTLREKERYESRFKHPSNKVIGLNRGDGDRSNERHVVGGQQEDTDETLKVILRGLGTLCQKIAQGTLKEPSPSIQKNLFAAADLLLEL